MLGEFAKMFALKSSALSGTRSLTSNCFLSFVLLPPDMVPENTIGEMVESS